MRTIREAAKDGEIDTTLFATPRFAMAIVDLVSEYDYDTRDPLSSPWSGLIGQFLGKSTRENLVKKPVHEVLEALNSILSFEEQPFKATSIELHAVRQSHPRDGGYDFRFISHSDEWGELNDPRVFIHPAQEQGAVQTELTFGQHMFCQKSFARGDRPDLSFVLTPFYRNGQPLAPLEVGDHDRVYGNATANKVKTHSNVTINYDELWRATLAVTKPAMVHVKLPQ